LRNHLTSIYSKLGLSNRVDLYAYATRNQAALSSVTRGAG
jgi:DNA-binding CsgD family transcriptional regulator